MKRIRPFSSVLAIALASIAYSFFATGVCAQSPPVWPTPVVIPTPSPTLSPSPEPTQPTPTPTPEPTEAPAPEVEPSPIPERGEGDSGEGGEDPVAPESALPANDVPPDGVVDDETPEGEEEINPGEMAFTDHQNFDLDEIEPEPFQSKWESFVAGFRGIARYSLFDGQVKFRLGARAQADGTLGSGDDKYEEFYQPIESKIDLRRFEIFAVGRIKKFNFNIAFELGPDWGFSDAWIEGAEGGLEVWGKYLGKLRLGWMNEPFSLERQTSSYDLGLMERSLPVQTISPGSNIGAMVHDSGLKGRFTWAIGLFTVGQSNDGNASNSRMSLTGRATHVLRYKNEGRDLIHVGLSLSTRTPTGGETRYRSRPEARFVQYLVDTGPIDASHITLVGLEFAAVRGPMWIAAEHIRSEVSAQLAGDPTFLGSYVKVGWFLTGERKRYRGNSGVFSREIPKTNYSGGNPFKKAGAGAWEIVGRLSRIDLNDGLIEGGELTNISGSLNWYLNATTRVEFNYIYASPKYQGYANIFLVRVQYRPW